MEKDSSAMRIFFAVFLLSPFLILFFHLPDVSLPLTEELIWNLRNTFLQATISSFGSVLLGLWGAGGLLSLRKSRARFIWEFIFLLPNFIPPLFVVLAIFKCVNPFVMGVLGVAGIHIFINAGLVAVLWARVLEGRVGGLAELALIEGTGRLRFTLIMLSMLKRELLLIFGLIFSVCFASFSVPLLAGGDQGTTLEVLIYEKVKLASLWSEALGIALLQAVFLFVLSFWTLKNRHVNRDFYRHLHLLSFPSGLLGGAIVLAVLIWGLGSGVIRGYEQLLQIGWSLDEIASKTLWTLFLSFTVGGVCFALLQVLLLLLPSVFLQGFLRGYLAPSTALTGFALMLVGSNEGPWMYLKIILALTLILLPFLYRLGWEQEWTRLQTQFESAHILGASHWMIYRKILLPQSAPMAGLLAGLAALWTSGDFAISGLLASDDFSLALVVDSLLSFYRLNAATTLSLLLILVGGFCFFFFWGVGRVLSQKS